jgi:hypothetical protein
VSEISFVAFAVLVFATAALSLLLLCDGKDAA